MIKKILLFSVVTLVSMYVAAQNKDGSGQSEKLGIIASTPGQQVNKLGNNGRAVQQMMGSCASVTSFSCGSMGTTSATGLTTGATSGLDSTSCQSGFDLSGGSDYYFSVTATDASTTQISVCFDNFVDDDVYAELILLGTTCQTGYASSCMQSAQWTVGTGGMGMGGSGGFSSGTDPCAFFSVPGPGTYYFVLDSQGDGVTSFDIADPGGGTGVSCATSTFSLDPGCSANDSDNDGIATSVNGTYTTTQQLLTPGSTYTICTDLYLQNTGWEWLDNVDISLGSCWTAVGGITPNGTGNEYYSASGGDWVGAYNSTTNEVNWSFTADANSAWGDGDSDDYTCYLYTFCFTGTIDATCTDPAGGTFSITCTDDGIGGNGATLTGTINSNEDTNEVYVNVNMLIEFVHTAGYSRGESNIIEWSVASEKDMDTYIVYRSLDAQNYEPIGEVKATNGSYDVNKYYFADHHPYKESYYRIKQRDQKGKIGHSDVIFVRNENVDAFYVVGRYDLMGKEVDEHFQGIYLELYSNGEVKRVLNQE